MPSFRVYYAERMPRGARDWMRTSGLAGAGAQTEEMGHKEVEWEEEVEATDARRALDSFFREHAKERAQVMWVDDTGESHQIRGIDDYDPEKTYIWIEDDKLMEYQGMDESALGMATCPLCRGEGEVVSEVAEEFMADEEQEEEGWS